MSGLQPDDFLERQKMDAAQVVIGIRRREAVQVRPADRGEEQRIGMQFNLPEQAWIVHHGRFFNAASEAMNLPERPDYEKANAFLIEARRSALSENLP